MVVVVGGLASGGKDGGLSRRKSRIGTGTPTPNDEMTIPIDVEILAEAMFRDTSLDELLDSLKHDYDYMVNWETRWTTGRDRGGSIESPTSSWKLTSTTASRWHSQAGKQLWTIP